MFSGNPVLASASSRSYRHSFGVSVGATSWFALKTLALFAVLLASAAFVWDGFFSSLVVEKGKIVSYAPWINVTAVVASIAAFLVALFVNRDNAAVLAWIYAGIEGFAIGAVSAVAEAFSPGVVLNAALATVAMFAVAWVLYTTRVIRVTARFASGVFLAMVGLCVIYFGDLILGAFGVNTGLVQGTGAGAWFVNIVAVVIASCCLIVDFSIIEGLSEYELDEHGMFYAFGLVLGVIWLYLELLRLFMKSKE